MDQFPNSPLKSVFLAGYDELIKCTPSEDNEHHVIPPGLAIQVSVDNISRSMRKARLIEKKNLEGLLLFLAISASTAPFIGLLGTVWGIMNAFEKIAATGSSSLTVVAPGVSEALIATAFGLLAAVPAVIAFNISQHLMRRITGSIDEFIGDFLNIIERYLLNQFSYTDGEGTQISSSKSSS
ncbi:MAG: MotA/TolQ/ExbB proton channel family protein [Proteobacteria bacterium]|nr:MotA/TolQ/ExbB proton channel family protein [Pseudomonadota bacterium]